MIPNQSEINRKIKWHEAELDPAQAGPLPEWA
jgi:hypothetical protein